MDEKHIEQAIREDPNVFCYDEVYDQVTSERPSDPVQQRSVAPKYMTALMHAHSEREVERERRLDRTIQRELEAEGDEFADKEVFVTNSYKQKLRKLQADEERRKEEEKVEDALDVKKQGNMNGFFKFVVKNMDRKRNYRTELHGKDNEDEEVEVEKEQGAEDSRDDETEVREEARSAGEADNDKSEENVEEKSREQLKKLEATEKRAMTIKEIQSKIKDKEREIRKILIKKTTGDALAEARLRYFERKRIREMISQPSGI